MKKMFSFLLAAIFLLSLVGCGESEDSEKLEKYEKYDGLIECIEDGKYERALEILNRLMEKEQGEQTDQSTGTQTGADTDGATTTAPTDEEQKGPDYSEFEKKVVGKWIPDKEEKDAYSVPMEFYADKSCTILDKRLTWDIEGVSDEGKEDQTIRVNVYESGKKVLSIQHRTTDFEFLHVNYCYDNDVITFEPDFSFYRESDYTAVEITLDKLSEYFEECDLVYFQKNAFGETDHADVVKYLFIKEGYKVNAALSQVAIEYEYYYMSQRYTVDIEKETVTFGEIVSEDEYVYKNDSFMRNIFMDGDTYRYGIDYLSGTTPITTFPAGSATRSQYTVLRVAGKIYVAK